MASFLFSNMSNSVIFCFCNVHFFKDLTQRFMRNVMSKSAEISRIGLPILHWQINHKLLLNFQSNLTSLRFLMMNFTLTYPKTMNFLHGYVLFWVSKNAVFLDFFIMFSICIKFLWFFHCAIFVPKAAHVLIMKHPPINFENTIYKIIKHLLRSVY